MQASMQYPKSCLAQAWDDTKLGGAFWSKSAFLALVNLVPILNFTVTGYALEWAREVPFGGRTALPKQVVNGKNFEFGFYAFVLSLVVGIVTSVVSGILGFIPVVGALLSIVLSFAASALLSLAEMRMIVFHSLGEGFRVQALWNAMQRNWGEFLAASLLPTLIGAVVASIVSTVFVVIAIVALIPVVGVVSAAGSTAASAGAVVGMGGTVLMLLVGVVVLAYLLCLVEAVVLLVTLRAVGHFIGRYVPEWTTQVTSSEPYPYTPDM